jgi:hypothetical protein
MTLKPKPLTDKIKETLINEHPDGLRVVLEEEHPQDATTAGDLLGIDLDDPDEILRLLRPQTDRVQ